VDVGQPPVEVSVSTHGEQDARLDVLAALRAALGGDEQGYHAVLAHTDSDEALRAALGFLVSLLAFMETEMATKVLAELTRAAIQE
jgi:hypothetical protein